MNTTKSLQYILLFILAVTLCLSFPLKDAKAYTCGASDADTICQAPEPACDSDNDGYWDDEECDGITLPDATNPSNSVTYTMDPTQQDLFLIIVPATDPSNTDCSDEASLLPADLLYPSTDPPTISRLGLTVHTLNVSQVDPTQFVGRDQRAIKMTEKCSTANPDVAGEAVRGLPTQGVYGAVFTYVIKDKIDTICPSNYACTDNSSVVDADILQNRHIIHTFNHEMGHMMALSTNYDRKAGYHWPAGTGKELDQFVDCSVNTKKKKTTCYISDVHAQPDIDGFRLN